MKNPAEISEKMIEILAMRSEPVAVFMPPPNEVEKFSDWPQNHKLFFCQAISLARRGEKIRLGPKGPACASAASVFGMRPTPKGFKGGRGLAAAGLTSNVGLGKEIVEGAPRLPDGSVGDIALSPLSAAPPDPDLVIAYLLPEQAMWLALAWQNLAGSADGPKPGGMFQAACLASAVIPKLENRLNYSLGCYGSREGSDVDESEVMVGFPGSMAVELIGELEKLNDRVIGRSRRKKGWSRHRK